MSDDVPTAYELLSAPAIGASVVPGSGVEFRVWAPGASRVEVLIEPDGRAIPMEPEDRGYHAAVVADAAPGIRYRFRLDGADPLPDPASRSQPEGVHGPSEVITPEPVATPGWTGLPLDRVVLYEAHVGTATPAGTFDGLVDELDHLANLGVTALELMPVAQFPGTRNWGYDGVFPFAVQDSYGGPAALRRLVAECHRRELAVVIDVVYNHLGPEGNVLRRFGPYFTDRYVTPWGDAVNYDGAGSDEVRRFFGGNALMWFEEYGVDALRLDAIHGIFDSAPRPFLLELSEATKELQGRLGRPLHLIAESPLNDPRVVTPADHGGLGLDAHWNEDFHHALHAALTGERQGYYGDYGDLDHLARSMAEGYAYQGETSRAFARRHGAPSVGIPPKRLVAFAQNHDQVGNRIGGERLSSLVSREHLKLAAGTVLLSPYVPLLFQGEEYGESAPFPYFVEHGDPELIEAVRSDRGQEFSALGWEGESPDPQAEETFESARLDPALREHPGHRELLTLYRELLRHRREHPALGVAERGDVAVRVDEQAPVIALRRRGGSRQILAALNFSGGPARILMAGLAGRWRLMIDSADAEWAGPGRAAPEELVADSRLTMAPWSFAVYDLVVE